MPGLGNKLQSLWATSQSGPACIVAHKWPRLLSYRPVPRQVISQPLLLDKTSQVTYKSDNFLVGRFSDEIKMSQFSKTRNWLSFTRWLAFMLILCASYNKKSYDNTTYTAAIKNLHKRNCIGSPVFTIV